MPEDRAALKILFRTDASPSLGGGHVMRCLALADMLAGRGCASIFVARSGTMEAVPALRSCGHGLVEVSGTEEEIRGQMRQSDLQGDWFVIDHYGIAAADETPLREFARRLLVLDDLADRRHDCDVLIDSTIDRTADAYAELVPAHTRILAGPAYALIRPSFLEKREVPRNTLGFTVSRPARIVVSMGLTDVGGITARIVEAVSKAGLPVRINCVLPGGAKSGKSLNERAATDDRLSIFRDVDDMAGLLAGADFAIGGGGQTSLERCALGVPSIIVVLAENQRENAMALAARGAAVIATPETVADRLAELLASPEKAASMAEMARGLVDAKGTFRIASLIAAPKIILRPVTEADSDVIFAWRNDAQTRAYSRNAGPVTRRDHEIWFGSRLDTPDVLHLMARSDGRDCGVVRFERKEGSSAEASLNLAPDMRGIGLGPAILAKAVAHAAGISFARTFFSVANAENAASIRLLEHCGFHRLSANDGWIRYVLSPGSQSNALGRVQGEVM